MSHISVTAAHQSTQFLYSAAYHYPPGAIISRMSGVTLVKRRMGGTGHDELHTQTASW